MKYILINQQIGHLFKDIIYDFSKRNIETIVISGWIEEGGKQIEPNVQILKGIRYNKKSTFFRLLTWTVFSFQISWYLLKYNPNNTKVLFVTNPPFGPLLSSLFRIPFAILIYDLYPDILAQTGIINKKNPIFTWWVRRNKKVFNKAEIIFTLSSSMKDAIMLYFSDSQLLDHKIHVISNWADNENIIPVPKNENVFLHENNLVGKFIILYSGNIGSTHPLESLIKVAESLKSHEDILFLFIGEGAKKILLTDLVQEKKLLNVKFFPYQPFEQIKFSLSAADINVIALEENAGASSVPSKTYSALAAGSVLLGITGLNSEVANLIKVNHAGKSFMPFETDGISEFILQMKSDPEQLSLYKRNALAASKHYTSSNASIYFNEWSKV